MTEHVFRQRWVAQCGGAELRYITRPYGCVTLVEALVVHEDGTKRTYLFRTPDDGVSEVVVGGRPSDEVIRCEFGLVKSSVEDYKGYIIQSGQPFAIPDGVEAIELGSTWYTEL